MQLTKCYVQDFGKLHEFEYSFNDKLNTILQENGWGKTTLASFIKAILFGLPTNKKADLDENDRQKYRPWAGGKFGGYVEFVLNNSPYRLERWFGDKEKDDVAILTDLNTNKPSTKFSTNIMQEYFNIDDDTYERSTYIPQNKITNDINDCLRAKLGNILQNEKSNNYNTAKEKLKEQRAELKLFRGKGGKIESLQNQIADTQKKIEVAESCQKQINDLRSQNSSLQTQIDQKINEIKSIDIQLNKISEQKSQSEILNRHNDIKNDLQKIQDEFNNINSFFKNNIPSSQQIDDCKKQITELNKLQEQLSLKIDSENNPQLKKLNNYFIRQTTEKEIDEYIEKNNKIKNNLIQINFSPSTQNNIEKIKNNKFQQTLKIIGLIIAFAGIALIITKVVLFGIILTAIGIICELITLFLPQKEIEQKIETNDNKQNLINQNNLLQNELNIFINFYNEDTNNIEKSLQNIKFNLLTYQQLSTQNSQLGNDIQSIKNKITTLKNNITSFLQQYINNYTNATDGLNTIVLQLERLSKTKQELLTQQNKLKEFENAKKLTLNNEKVLDNDNFEQLSEQKTQLSAELQNLRELHTTNLANIKQLSNDASSLNILQTTHEQLKQEIKSFENQKDILDKCIEYLDLANESLTSKYLAPMTNGFKKYASMLVGHTLDDVNINTSLNVTIEKLGNKKDKKYFSKAYRDIMELCMRFALIDAIFPNEKPPIILDDPYVNLDEEKLKSGIELLNKISNENQIIYLICHNSRK